VPIRPFPPPTPPAPPAPPPPPPPPPPLQPGALAPPIGVTVDQLQQLIVTALGALYVAPDQTAPQQVVWYDHDGEALAHLDRTQVRLGNGLVLVALTLETDQTGLGQVTVPLGIGSPQMAAGLLVVTEATPRGPTALVDRWGDTSTAASWRALLDAAHALALQGGVDTSGARLVPGALSCDGKMFSVIPQARHALDAVVGR